MLIMVKNSRKGKPGAGAWQRGEGAGACGAKVWGMRGEGMGHGTSLPGTAWTWHCDIRGEHGDNCEVL